MCPYKPLGNYTHSGTYGWLFAPFWTSSFQLRTRVGHNPSMTMSQLVLVSDQ
jgi:hypothetical protein